MTRLFPEAPDERGTLNPGAFAETLAAVAEANPDYRLVGSLGRAVLYDRYFADPYREFDMRDELPLRTRLGTARDLDLLNAPNPLEIDQPYPIDTVWANNPDSAITTTDSGDWRLRSTRYGFDELIEPEVMESVKGWTVYNIEAVTVRPQTHLALFAVRGSLRKKDDIPAAMIADLRLHTDAERLPESYYDPFWELADLQQRGMLAQLRRRYRRYASEAVMNLTGKVLNRINR